MINLEPQKRPTINSVLNNSYFKNQDLNRISLVLDIEKLNGSSLNHFDPPIKRELEKINNNNRASILNEEVSFEYIYF